MGEGGLRRAGERPPDGGTHTCTHPYSTPVLHTCTHCQAASLHTLPCQNPQVPLSDTPSSTHQPMAVPHTPNRMPPVLVAHAPSLLLWMPHLLQGAGEELAAAAAAAAGGDRAVAAGVAGAGVPAGVAFTAGPQGALVLRVMPD